MNKATILQWSGMDSETVDFALRLEWCKDVSKLNIDNNHFFWHYPKDGENKYSGRPMCLSECFIKAIQNGNLVPLSTVEAALEMALRGEHTKEQIIELVKMQCASE